ncbi:putative DNA-directed RNA polymerase [Helianthus annuus]|nr:putative DNA-directed RNA polymerase [Helianthus annuus]
MGLPLIAIFSDHDMLITFIATPLHSRLIWKNDRRRYIQEQTILIGKIPIMTSLGAFIVNGIYRIVINQILQSPGIYYQSELNDNGISVYTGTIISDWGGRLELEIDRKARIWVRVSRQQKLSILVLLSAMGLNIREILENVCYPELFLSFLNDKKKIGSKENAILEFYQQFACVEGDPVFSESLSKDLQKKFFQQRCELGGIGRRNMNRRLNLDIPQNNTFLLPRDILAAADRLIRIKFGMGTLDDMNHLQNKRIRSVADLLQEQFGLALVRLENMARGNIYAALKHNWTPTPQNLVNSTPLTDTYKVFFRLHPLSQVLDRTNPLTQIVHGRKLSYLGPGGLTARTATFPIRDIHPSHYGRICPIDTSEGINVGLIGSLAIHARIGRWGSLESPFYQISERSKGAQMLYLSPGRDEYYMVAAGNSLALNQGIQEEQVVPARYRQEFLTIAWEQVQLRSIFAFQYFSIGASLIPFIEHNDANRALMSSNMQRQAVPLSQSEKCIVGTGLEGQAALDSGALAIAEHEGKIFYTDTDKILLSGNGDTLRIPLVMYQRSNKNILVIGPVPGQKYSEITFPILSPDPATKKDIHFLKYPIYVGGNRGRGQIYPDGSKSNNTVYNATASGIVSKILRKEKGGYEITIADASDGRQVVDIIPPGPELLVSEGESIKLDQPLTSNPNVGGFGQGDAEIVLQDPLRVQGLLFFFAAVILAQIFLVLKKKQFEKVQLSEMNF